jgi:hypothetical protein
VPFIISRQRRRRYACSASLPQDQLFLLEPN